MTELNQMDRLAMGLCDKIEAIFGDRIDTISIYDIVEDPSHSTFKLKFMAYDYCGIRFDYKNDLCGFTIVLNDEFSVSLEDGVRSYAGTQDWEAYLREIMAKIELRIPDKFLKANGWL